ncbi:MAG: TrkH family potassium uptake protein [Paracoccaceae bacterium]
MLKRILDLPFFVILMGVAALAMFLPAAHASITSQDFVARAFFYSGILFLTLTALIAIATATNKSTNPSRNHLLSMLAAFIVLPLMLAVPFNMAVGNTTFLSSYVEMVSSLTTTGATLYEPPERLPESVHLWRALVGWMGGFLTLVTAIAILAPMNLGGFEVLSSANERRVTAITSESIWVSDGARRLQRFSAKIFPIYFGLTLVLWIVLLLLGDRPLVAICHAMSTLATSGISPIGGLQNGSSGFGGELAIFLLLIFALSRQIISPEQSDRGYARIFNDPEFRIGVYLVLAVTGLLFVRHWIGAFEVDEIGNPIAALSALWGAGFTVLSFLTTTGFQSSDWVDARTWSGLATPGIILMGLALTGGGVATTAGGVKLLRVYALYKHGLREMDRLVHPSSVGGAGSAARRLRREGAYAAWVFFMLFALSLAATVIAFTLTGLDFESAIAFAVASLSTTGPVVAIAGGEITGYAALTEPGKLVLATAMVLGRLEMLVIIALFAPDFWRS